ncbi:olfactory receptor 13-like [Boleophthalmus pectinirostris]|uniref:olfactory receptor 13-like n=1 Tax=Boleophthalmus pectinirostris TaxID=150288 RepID=UPI00242D7A0D|nr:olfactory receptor 13-like [Boleophthalmus pectinirostris]
MENMSSVSDLLQLEGLPVPASFLTPAFLALFFSHLFIVTANVGVIALICSDSALHQPMYILLCQLSFNDIMGNIALVPRLLYDLPRPPRRRLISLGGCVVQAFITHLFSTNNHTILMIMAFDRYAAICTPLQYSAVMSGRTLMALTVAAWGVGAVLVTGLLGLTLRLSRCRSLLLNAYCDNASLFKLSCESTFINNVYGLTFTVVLLTSSIGSIVVTYSYIAVACATKRSSSLNRKALQTCSTHLLLYLVMFTSGILIIALHRYPSYEPYRKISTILFNIIPPALNPVIYGFQCHEIHQSLRRLLCRCRGQH